MTIGSELQRARVQLRKTTSEVAAATRMKVQTVEAIEREDFDTFAAPIYGKGFIRLFAEQVGLDPVPLIQEYMAQFAKPAAPSLINEEDEPESSETGATDSDEEELDLFSRMAPPRQTVETFGEKVRRKRRGRNVRTTHIRERIESLKKVFREKMDRMLPPSGTSDESLEPDERNALREEDVARPLSRIIIRWTTLGVGAIFVIVLILSGLSRIGNNNPNDTTRQAPAEKLRLVTPPPPPYFDTLHAPTPNTP